MIRLPSKQVWTLAPGNLIVPGWMEPILPPVNTDLRAWWNHKLIVGIDNDTLRTWLDEVGYERPSHVQTLAALFTLWMRLCQHQLKTTCDIMPSDDLGFIVYEQCFKR